MSTTFSHRTIARILIGFLCAVTFLTPISLSITAQNSFTATVHVVDGQETGEEAEEEEEVPTRDTGEVDQASREVQKAKDDNTGFWNCLLDRSACIGMMILGVASSITMFGGWIFDLAVENLVLEFGQTAQNSDFGNTIDRVWSLIRDICNLAFIFGFVYIGIRTIISPDSSSLKTVLAQIIIGALLINFSLFITKIVIDFSNLAAIEIYSAMVPTPEHTISERIADQLGIATFFKTPQTEFLKGLTGWGEFWFFFMASIFLLVAGFTLASAGFLLIARFGYLIFAMVFSPVLFAATVFPQTKQYSSTLWGILFRNAFFAPVFLLLLYVSLELTGAFKKTFDGSSDFVTAFTSTGQGIDIANKTAATDSLGVILVFCVIIFFVVSSLIIAKSMGIAGSNMVIKTGNNLRRGMQGYLGRGLLGANIKGYGLGAGIDKVAKTQEEWRNSNDGTRRFGAWAMRASGVNAGAKAAQGAKFGSDRSRADVTKENKEIARARAKNQQVDQTRAYIRAGSADNAPVETVSAMERSIADSSNEQVLALLKQIDPDKNPAEYAALAASLTQGQFDSVMKEKPEEFDDNKKAKLRAARSTAVRTRLSMDNPVPGGASVPGKIGNASTADLEALGFATLNQHAGHLTAKQIDDLKNLTRTEKTQLKDSREAQLLKILRPTAAGSTPGSARTLFAHVGKDVEISKLPASILTDRHFTHLFNENILTKILDNDSITTDHRIDIKNKITTYPGTPATIHHYFTTPIGSRF